MGAWLARNSWQPTQTSYFLIRMYDPGIYLYLNAPRLCPWQRGKAWQELMAHADQILPLCCIKQVFIIFPKTVHLPAGGAWSWNRLGLIKGPLPTPTMAVLETLITSLSSLPALQRGVFHLQGHLQEPLICYLIRIQGAGYTNALIALVNGYVR